MNKYLAIYNGKNKRFRHDGDEFQREAARVAAVRERDGILAASIKTEAGWMEAVKELQDEIRELKKGAKSVEDWKCAHCGVWYRSGEKCLCTSGGVEP